LLGTDQEEERVLVEPEETEGEKKPTSPRQPSPQPGSALSLNPPAGSDVA
jgi:hypothetical protein